MSAGAASVAISTPKSDMELMISKDEKIRFLRMIQNIIRVGVPTSESFTFKHDLNTLDLAWVITNVKDIEKKCECYMPTFGISYSLDIRKCNTVFIIASKVTRKNRSDLVCNHLDFIIEHLDEDISYSNSEIKKILPRDEVIAHLENISNKIEKIKDDNKKIMESHRVSWFCWCC